MDLTDLSDARRGKRNGVTRFTRAEIQRRSRARHPETRTSYLVRPEVRRARCISTKTYREANPEKITQHFRNWEQKKGPLGMLLYRAKRGASQRGLEFTISEKDFDVLPSHCPVFGIKLDYVGTPGRDPRSAEKASRASLDRKDNSKGYIPGNVFVVSFRANQLKSDGTASELRALANWMEK